MSEAAGEAARKRICRCEARIAPAILEAYACGNPDCWRTAQVAASFEEFVAKLTAEREEGEGRQAR